jgi:hypothetical protein
VKERDRSNRDGISLNRREINYSGVGEQTGKNRKDEDKIKTSATALGGSHKQAPGFAGVCGYTAILGGVYLISIK